MNTNKLELLAHQNTRREKTFGNGAFFTGQKMIRVYSCPFVVKKNQLSCAARPAIQQAMNYFLPALIGLFSGVASGLFGVGGGIVMVPAMIFFMQMPIHKAVGTSLLVIIPTAIVGSWKHFQAGNVVGQTALMLMPTAILGGYFGSWLANELSADNLKKAFGGFLILVGARLLLFK